MVQEFRGRVAEHPIAELMLRRWSPRAMSGEAVSEAELMTLFEAARWAPSSGNEQPWRFVYARKGTVYWDEFFSLLGRGNREWCTNAGVLIITLSRKTWEEDDTPNDTHSFDTGAAWENLALHGSILGLVVHGMAGFDYERARELLGVSDAYAIEMMIAIGKRGDSSVLSEKNKAREKPSERKTVDEFAFEGRLPHQRA